MNEEEYNRLSKMLFDLEVEVGYINDGHELNNGHDIYLKKALNVLSGSIQLTRHELVTYGVNHDNTTED